MRLELSQLQEHAAHQQADVDRLGERLGALGQVSQRRSGACSNDATASRLAERAKALVPLWRE